MVVQCVSELRIKQTLLEDDETRIFFIHKQLGHVLFDIF